MLNGTEFAAEYLRRTGLVEWRVIAAEHFRRLGLLRWQWPFSAVLPSDRVRNTTQPREVAYEAR
jgi:hypothetical protein